MLQLTKMMNCTLLWISLETNPPLFMKSRSVEYKNEKKNFERRKNERLFWYTDCPTKKLQSAFGYRLQKKPLWNQKKLTGLWNYNYFPTIQWRPHLIWSSSHKEIKDFSKASHRSLSSKFCHLNVCGFHRQIVFTKDRLANILKFYAYLSNKGCSWQPKSLSDM